MGEPGGSRSGDGFVAPMLARPGALPSGSDWWAEVKWDGVRIIGRVDDDGARLWGRRGVSRTNTWPEFAAVVDALGGRHAVLDGEAVVTGADERPRFDLVQRRMNVTDPMTARRLAAELPATWMVFDLLELDGRSLLREPLSERRRLLLDVLEPVAGVRVPTVHDDPAALLGFATERGLEGIVVKRPSSTYSPGRRSDGWIKVKATHEDEFVVGGWFSGSGGRSSTFGSLALGLPIAENGSAAERELRYVGAVGSGFSIADLDRLHRVFSAIARPASSFVEGDVPAGLHPVDPLVSVRVRYGEWTPDGVLRHPVMLGVSSVRSVPPATDAGEE